MGSFWQKCKWSAMAGMLMLLGLMMVPVQAKAAKTENGQIQSVVRVNPHYEGIVNKGQLILELDKIRSSSEDELVGAGTVYNSENEAGVALRAAMKNRQESVSIAVKSSMDYDSLCKKLLAIATEHTGNPTEGDYIGWQYGGYGTRGSVYAGTYNITFSIWYYTTSAQEAQMDTAVAQLLSQLGIAGKTTRYDKVSAIYDWMCQNISYDYANLNDGTYLLKHTAYAALINKTAVCQGYAVLLYRLLLEAHIDNRVITSIDHAWNIIKMGGLYYNADSTWDASGYGHYYFLRSPTNFLDHKSHIREPQYTTAEFEAKYPMSPVDYQVGVGDNDPDDQPVIPPANPDPVNPDPVNPDPSTPSEDSDWDDDDWDDDDWDDDDWDDDEFIDLDDCTIKLEYSSVTYTGKALRPKVSITFNGTKLPASEYTVTYKNNVNVGKATVIVDADGESLYGYDELNFNIVPKKTSLTSVKSSKKGELTIKWKKQASKSTGYQIFISKKSSFPDKSTTKKTIGKNSTTSAKVTKLSKKTTYYVKIRVYKTVSGKKYYSSWSKVLKCKTK